MKKERIVAIILILVLVSSTVGYAISSMIMNKKIDTEKEVQAEVEESLGYVQNLQNALNQAMIDKNFVKQSSVDDLLKRNEADDYTLSAALNILGTPVCVLESIDSYAITSYTNKEEIVNFLANIPTNTKYSDKSFIQLYWMKENGEAIITWISFDNMNEIKIIGIITSQYQDLNDMNLKEMQDYQKVIDDVGISKEKMLEKYKPIEYKTQYKLLPCLFVLNMMTNEYEHIWSEYLLKNEYGYLHLNTRDDTYYMVYQTFENFENIPAYTEEQLTSITEAMTIEEFEKIIPDAILYKKELNEGHTYLSYVVKVSETENELYYFDFTDGILEIELEDTED